MDVLVKLTVPNCVFQFYQQAASHIAEGSPEQIMSDALSAYAGMLSRDVSAQLKPKQDDE